MGNHEWCSNCEESDFHNHRECDPVKVAQRIERERIQKERRDRLTLKMKQALDGAGIQYEMDQYGNALVRPWSFE
jgi:hypothetical protein